MKFVWILFFLCLMDHSAYGAKGRLYPREQVFGVDKEVSSGDVVAVTMEIWPKKELFYLKKEALSFAPFGDHFFLLEVNDLSPSPYNEDVLILKGDLLILGDFVEKSEYRFSYFLRDFIFTIEGMIFSDSTPLEVNELIFFPSEKEVFYKRHGFIFFIKIILFLVLITLGVIGGLFIKKKKLKKRRLEQIGHWHDRFAMAVSRDDITALYDERKKWKEFCLYKENLLPFYEWVRINQYKKLWDAEDLRRGKNLLSQIELQPKDIR